METKEKGKKTTEKKTTNKKTTINKYDLQIKIYRLVKLAERNGFGIAVARDAEGNGYNILNSKYMICTDTKPDKIVLGVWKGADESELFNK